MNLYFSFSGITDNPCHPKSHFSDICWHGDTTVYMKETNSSPYPYFEENVIRMFVESLPKTKRLAFDKLKEGQSMDLGAASNDNRRWLYKLTAKEIKTIEEIEAKKGLLAVVNNRINRLIPTDLSTQKKLLMKEISKLKKIFK